MRRKISVVLLIVCFVFAIYGCSFYTAKTFTYSVETGDMVRVELDTTDGYDITSDVPFAITYNGTTLSQGTFFEGELFESYVETANSEPNVVVLEEGTKDGNQYLFWSYDDRQFNYALRVGGSDTGMFIGNSVSEESARECFDRLTISLE